jgi:hypothetical protein
MKALLTALCFLFCLAVSAQNDEHYLISLRTNNIELKVISILIKFMMADNLKRYWSAQKSIGNSKTQFKSPFVDELGVLAVDQKKG